MFALLWGLSFFGTWENRSDRENGSPTDFQFLGVFGRVVSEETVNSEDICLSSRLRTLNYNVVASILTREQTQQYKRFRKEICLSETKTGRYELCARKRDGLLVQEDSLQVLFAVYEQAMSASCTEYKR